ETAGEGGDLIALERPDQPGDGDQETAGDRGDRRQQHLPGQSARQYWLITVTPSVPYLSIDSSTLLASPSPIVRCTSLPGLSLPLSTMRSMAGKCGACMPREPMICTSFSTMMSIGSEISPCSALDVRPICRGRPRLRTHMTELRQVAATPSASIDTCAPPPVSDMIAPTGSSFAALTTCTAPSPLAAAGLGGGAGA